MGVTATGTSSLIATNPFGGWVCQDYFGERTLVGDIIVNNCYSNGSIASSCGGIFGYLAGISSSGNIVANNCYSTGPIGSGGGGIFGNGAGRSSSANIVANNCYSSGIIGDNGGGIFGSAAGIFSQGSATISANNCYSIGSIGTDGGGIFGAYAGYFSSANIEANNCYTTGTITTDGNGIFGSTNIKGTASNCYFTNGISNWNDSSANSLLITNTNVWTDINNNSTTPWLLSSFNSNIYSPNSYTGNSTTYTTDQGLFQSNYTYSIFKINGSYNISTTIITNTNNGKITFTNPSTSYTVNVLVYKVINGNYYQYNINTFTYTYI